MPTIIHLPPLDVRSLHGVSVAHTLLAHVQGKEGVCTVTVGQQAQADLVSTAIRRFREKGLTKVIVNLDCRYV